MTPREAHFEAMPDEGLRDLARRLLGRPPPRGRKKIIAALEEALGDPAALSSLVAPLGASARRVLELLCEAGHPLPERDLRRELHQALGEVEAERGMGDLVEAGLIVEGRAGAAGRVLGLFPPLAPALRRLFDAHRAPADKREAPGAPRGLGFASRVLLADLATSRPRMLAYQLDIHGQDAKKIRKRMGGINQKGFYCALQPLLDLGLIERAADGRSRVDTERVERVCGWNASYLDLHLLARRLMHLDDLEMSLLVYLARRPRPVRRKALIQAGRLAYLREQLDYYFYVGGELSHRTEWSERALRQLVELDFAIRSEDGREVELAGWVRRALDLLPDEDEEPSPPAEPPELDRVCLVQPNFEVIVPPEAGPWTVFQVSRAAVLRRFDQVATFQIDRAAVQAAVSSGLAPDAILDALSSLSVHPLPDNVARGVRDFAAGVRIAYLVDVPVVLVPGAGPGAAPPDKALAATPLDGVYLAPHGVGAGLSTRLKRAGLSISTLEAPGTKKAPDRPGPVTQQNNIESIQRLRSFLDREGFTPRGAGPAYPPLPAPPADLRPAPKPGGGEGGAGRKRPSEGGDPDLPLLVLLKHAFSEAPGAWLEHAAEHLAEELADEIADLVESQGLDPYDPEDLVELLRTDPGELVGLEKALKLLIDDALAGFDCCHIPPLVGPHAARAALEHGSDLFLVPLDSAELLRLTPHRVSRRGEAWRVDGHLVETGELRSFDLNRVLAGPAPASSPADLEIAREQPAPPKVGRNDPCPCGSGKKYKKCCYRKDRG